MTRLDKWNLTIGCTPSHNWVPSAFGSFDEVPCSSDSEQNVAEKAVHKARQREPLGCKWRSFARPGAPPPSSGSRFLEATRCPLGAGQPPGVRTPLAASGFSEAHGSCKLGTKPQTLNPTLWRGLLEIWAAGHYGPSTYLNDLWYFQHQVGSLRPCQRVLCLAGYFAFRL